MVRTAGRRPVTLAVLVTWAALAVSGCGPPEAPSEDARVAQTFTEFDVVDASEEISVTSVRVVPADGSTGWAVTLRCQAEAGCRGVGFVTIEYDSPKGIRYVKVSDPVDLASGGESVLNRVEPGTLSVDGIRSVSLSVRQVERRRQ